MVLHAPSVWERRSLPALIKASLRNQIGLFLGTNPKRMASRTLEVYPLVGRANRMEAPAHPSMSIVNAEHVGPAIVPEKKLSTMTVTGSRSECIVQRRND